MVHGHVCFYLFGVGAGRRFPAGFLGRDIEIIGEIFGIGVADFPLVGEAGFVGRLEWEVLAEHAATETGQWVGAGETIVHSLTIVAVYEM